MHPSGFRFHQGRQGVHIGAAQLAEGAVLQHQGHHRVVVFQFFEHGGVGAPAGLGPAGFLALQPQGVEQQLAQLFGGGEIEVHTGGLAGPDLQVRQGGGQFRGELRQVGAVDADAGGLHGGQHRFEGQFHLLQQCRQGGSQGRELLAQQPREPPGDMDIHTAVLRGRRDRHGREADSPRH